MDNNWTPVIGDDLHHIIDILHPVDGKYEVSVATTSVGKRNLPFYRTAQLLRLKDRAWHPQNLFIYYLRLGDALFRLDGTSPPLHDLNAKAPIEITDENVIDYLEFFCFFVRGEEGPFLIAQTTADTYVPKQVDDKTAVVLENTLRPAYCEGQDEAGNWICDATIYYSNAIFTANFVVEPSGMIKLEDDQPIAADLPVKVDAPLA